MRSLDRFHLIPVVLLGVFALGLGGCSAEAKRAALQKKADTHFNSGDFDKAEIEYKNIIQAGGRNPHAIARLGIIYVEQGRFPRGYSYLVTAKELEPANVEIQRKLAQFYASNNKTLEARDAAIFVLEKQPGDVDAAIVLAELAGQPREIADARNRLQALPPTAGTTAALAILDLRERKFGEAESLLNRAKEMDSNLAAVHMTFARLYWARNDLEQADKSFARAVAVSRPRSQNILTYARFKSQIGKGADAKLVLDEAIAKSPDFLSAYMARASLATAEKKHEESISLYEKVLQRDPENPEALLFISQERLAIGATDQALAALQKVTSTYPGSALGHLQLGNAYLANKDLPRAAASLSEAIRLFPAGTPAPVIALARVHLLQGSHGPAVAALQPIVDKNPANADARLLLAEALQRQGNLTGALTHYRQLADASPQNSDLQFRLGTVYVQQRKAAEARQAFQNALNISPTLFVALEQLVVLDIEENQFDSARSRLQAYSTANPQDAAPHWMLAQVSLKRSEKARAVEELTKAIELRPDVAASHVLLAQMHIDAGRFDDAIKTLKEATTKTSNDLSILMMLGQLQSERRDNAGAKETYEKALARDPNSVEALNNMSYLLAGPLNELDKALDLAQRARDLRPADPAIADTLGWILYKMKSYSRAVTLLDESAERLADNPEVRYHAGMAHYMMGNESVAKTVLKAALELNGNFDGNIDARESLALLDLDVRQAGESARPLLEKALSRRPDDPIALVRMAMLYEQAGKVDQAMAAYETALKSNSSNVAAVLGVIRIQRGRNEVAKALELAKATRRAVPGDGRLGHVLGRLAYENGERTFSVGVLQESARRLENDPDVQLDLAEAAYSVGQLTVAENALRAALQIPGEFKRATHARQMLEFLQATDAPTKALGLATRADSILKADPNDVPALMVKGIAERHRGEVKAAKETFEKAFARFPEFTPARRQLAILYSTNPEDAKRGVEHATKAREAYSTDSELAKAFGIILYHQGTFARAVNLLTESSRARSNDAELHFYLGMSQRQLKDTAAAKRSLERALELELPPALAEEARKALAEKA